MAENGDLNPYAVVVVGQSVGDLEQGDVLIDNFNNISNLQGTGTTLLRYRPSTKEMREFARISPKTANCPGGVGLSTALAVLSSGWVIVGSTPSTDGTTATKGAGCLLVLDAQGHHRATWAGPTIDAPWGNMAVIDDGERAQLFVSMAGHGLQGPDVVDPQTHYPEVHHEATVLRLDLSIAKGEPPKVTQQTVIASGFAQRADRDNFLFGPTGLVLGPDDTLYVTDGLDNEITAVSQASTRSTSEGKGRVVTQDGLLAWPLAMVLTPAGHLIVNNGKNGQTVEIDPQAGKQIYAHWLNANQAQSPPGNGNLFGLAMAPDGKGFYYVEDDINSLRLATP